MSKYKILHICNLTMNGKAVFLANLLKNTDFAKYDVTVLNFRGGIAQPIEAKIENIPIRIINPPKDFGGFLKCYWNTLRKEKYDVVHSHIWDLSGIFVLIARIAGVPIRATHSHNSMKISGRYSPIKVFFRDKVIWNILKKSIKWNANRYYSCSNIASQWLYDQQIIESKKHHIVPNGIDLEVFKPDLSKNMVSTRILFVGRFLEQKNPLFAIQVFAEYKKLDLSANLVMVGNGRYVEECKKMAEKLCISDDVDLISQSDRMCDIYKNASILIMPSLYEGLPLTLVEAQACGLKCLVSDVVTKEIDLGLIRYESLEKGPNTWAHSLMALKNADMRVNKVLLQNFSCQNTAKIVYDSYELS